MRRLDCHKRETATASRCESGVVRTGLRPFRRKRDPHALTTRAVHGGIDQRSAAGPLCVSEYRAEAEPMERALGRDGRSDSWRGLGDPSRRRAEHPQNRRSDAGLARIRRERVGRHAARRSDVPRGLTCVPDRRRVTLDYRSRPVGSERRRPGAGASWPSATAGLAAPTGWLAPVRELGDRLEQPLAALCPPSTTGDRSRIRRRPSP